VTFRGLGNIEDGEDVIVFVDLGARDFAFDDSAEYIFHYKTS
jgi:hypothetical protein